MAAAAADPLDTPARASQNDRMVDDVDRAHLRRCVDLARTALETGNEPFGSLLTDGDGQVLFEDHNRTSNGDQTRHPEFAIARWSAAHLTPEQRSVATVYTSGEHCPMCAAAHAWVGLGRIVYASSSAQLTAWREAMELPPPPVRPMAITELTPGVIVDGPVDDLAEEVHELQQQYVEQHG